MVARYKTFEKQGVYNDGKLMYDLRPGGDGVEYGESVEALVDMMTGSHSLTVKGQLHLQNLVIDAFVPPEELTKLEKRAVWDEDGSEE